MDEAAAVRPCFDAGCRHWTDLGGRRIEAHGAGMLQSPHDARWYWYGESAKSAPAADGRVNEERLWSQGVNCYSATSMSGPWRNEGQVLRQSDVRVQGLSGPFVIERPKVLHNALTGKFVMWLHLDRNLDGGNCTQLCSSADERLRCERQRWYQLHRVGVATAAAAAGPFTWSHSLQPDGLPSLDMSLFHDPLDGQAYLIRSVANRYNAISRLSADFLGSQGVISTHRPVFEGMALFRHANGTYYCITSHLTGFRPNGLMLLRAEGASLDDPKWTNLGNPTGDPTSFNSQPAFVVSVTRAGGEPYFVYLGDNWLHGGEAGLPDAAYVWLPLRFSRHGVTLSRQVAWSADDPFGNKASSQKIGRSRLHSQPRRVLVTSRQHTSSWVVRDEPKPLETVFWTTTPNASDTRRCWRRLGKSQVLPRPRQPRIRQKQRAFECGGVV